MKSKDSAGRTGVRLRTLVFGLSAVLVAIGVVVAGASLYVSNGFKESGRVSETLMASMRAHMTADMLHDRMRGLVFRGLYAGISGDFVLVKATHEDIMSHSTEFREAIAAQDQLDVPPAVRSALDGVKGDSTPISPRRRTLPPSW